MASVIIGTALVNALAFSGSSFLFSKLNKPDYEKERKRHDLAIEKLNEETQKWEHARKLRQDFLNRELQKRNIAERDFKNVDDAMDLYHLYFPNVVVQSLPPKPTLQDFYTPSETARSYEYLWIIGGMFLMTYIGWKYKI